jgi:nitrite reductase/ring-hydroxylating ferredoxin subunit
MTNDGSDATRPFAGTLNPEYPTAWWIVALSADVARGRAVPLRTLERDLVLWRGYDGTVHCQEAHCLHLGAHLGYGGEVRKVRGGSTVQCPFHGWSYDADGNLAGQIGPPRPTAGLCLPTYRTIERDGVVLLWNGDGEPDHRLPDLYEFYGLSRQDFFTVAHRLHMPFPAKYFAENICDAMHFAVAHGAAEWGEAIALEETATMIRIENRLHNFRPWYTWRNLARLYRRGELLNMLTPVRGSLFSTSYGATVHFTHIDNTGRWGDHLVCWTPTEADAHHFFAIDMVPRPRPRIAEPLLRRLIAAALRVGLYSTAVQDAAVLTHRAERPRPPYARFDKGLIAFRRHWDSRIQAGARDGDGVRSNGARAGVRAVRKEVDVP